jgi:hypothetical protein
VGPSPVIPQIGEAVREEHDVEVGKHGRDEPDRERGAGPGAVGQRARENGARQPVRQGIHGPRRTAIGPEAFPSGPIIAR